MWVCVGVCVCARVCARVRVCVCVCFLQLSSVFIMALGSRIPQIMLNVKRGSAGGCSCVWGGWCVWVCMCACKCECAHALALIALTDIFISLALLTA